MWTDAVWTALTAGCVYEYELTYSVLGSYYRRVYYITRASSQVYIGVAYIFKDAAVKADKGAPLWVKYAWTDQCAQWIGWPSLEGKSLTSVARLYVWTIPVSSSGCFIRDIIHATALDFRHYYDKFTSVMTPRKKSLSIFLCFCVGYSVSAGRWQQVKLTVAGVDDVLFGPTGSAQPPHQYRWSSANVHRWSSEGIWSRTADLFLHSAGLYCFQSGFPSLLFFVVEINK